MQGNNISSDTFDDNEKKAILYINNNFPRRSFLKILGYELQLDEHKTIQRKIDFSEGELESVQNVFKNAGFPQYREGYNRARGGMRYTPYAETSEMLLGFLVSGMVLYEYETHIKERIAYNFIDIVLPDAGDSGKELDEKKSRSLPASNKTLKDIWDKNKIADYDKLIDFLKEDYSYINTSFIKEVDGKLQWQTFYENKSFLSALCEICLLKNWIPHSTYSAPQLRDIFSQTFNIDLSTKHFKSGHLLEIVKKDNQKFADPFANL